MTHIRYRLPIDILLIFLAVQGFMWLVGKMQKKHVPDY
jgi:nitrogen fixation-related uncharacterized protein